MRLTLIFLAASLCLAQPGDPASKVGNGVTQPRVLYKPDPTYSKEAEREHVQGTALYSLVVDKSGHTREIEVLSPIGYGLDEKGAEAIGKWTFAPGTKDGVPVNVRAQIEVNFRFHGLPFDDKRAQHRTEYNRAVHDIQTPANKAKGIESIRQLAAKKFTPAMATLGQWMMEGKEVPKDIPAGLDLIKKAADRYDREGMFALGKLYETGEAVPADPEKALKLIRDAAMSGSEGARMHLGLKYANGQGVPVDVARAEYYFRLCAAHNVGLCQLWLARSLIQSGAKKDTVTAAAWLQLAKANDVKGVDPLLAELLPALTPEETAAANKLKGQLLRR